MNHNPLTAWSDVGSTCFPPECYLLNITCHMHTEVGFFVTLYIHTVSQWSSNHSSWTRCHLWGCGLCFSFFLLSFLLSSIRGIFGERYVGVERIFWLWFKVAYSCIVLTILVVALILLCNVIPMCVLPFLGDNTSCCQDKHRSNMSSNILNKRSAVAD